jgi:hypothetical protein
MHRSCFRLKGGGEGTDLINPIWLAMSMYVVSGDTRVVVTMGTGILADMGKISLMLVHML